MTHVEIDDDALVLTGTGVAPRHAHLRGPRARVTGEVVETSAGWSARVPLVASRWGGPVLPLPAGEYRLDLADATPDANLALQRTAAINVTVAGGRVVIAAPLDPAYVSGDGQAALERRYTAQRGTDPQNAVFFESFYGRNASCNPRAIDAEIARRAPGVTRYWSVVDLSVVVPDGAIAVVEGSPQWWRVRASARLLVVNDWLRRRFVRRPGQHVLQTWHGTPLKRLALHRPGFDPRRAVAVWRESRRWDALLAQNPYAADILRSAYAFRRPVWVEGYPRNDVLSEADGAAVRRSLGIGAEERVLLYAPTWRDDRTEMVDHLDAARLAENTGAVVLVRGHSRTLIPGHDAEGPRVIDVTGYPDTAQLIVAADALITDYSSIMFDFSVTGRPMYFLVPDIEHYRGELRGFYFDLAEEAPGPLVSTQDELERALADVEGVERHALRYAAWRERFNARDDGRAAERVVSRLIDQRWIEAD